MATTFSVSGTLLRSNNFTRNIYRSLSMNSGAANKTFESSLDLSVSPAPVLPLQIPTVGITTINFLYIEVIGGSAVIRLSKTGDTPQDIDITVAGTVLLSGVDLNEIYVQETPTEGCYVNIIGTGL